MTVNQIRALLIAIALLVGGTSLYYAFKVLNPTPPKILSLSTGPEGGTYDRLGQEYRDRLARNGIEVQLLPSSGSIENLTRLREGSVDFGFVNMGTPDARDGTSLGSLGAMFYEPLWLFARNAQAFQGDASAIGRQRISIGPRGSRTYAASRYLFSLNGLDPTTMNLVELLPGEAVDQLMNGELDAMAMVSGSASPLIKRMLAEDGVELVDFERARAYEALFPELTRLVVPAGVGSLARDLPPEDVQILAFTTIMATRDGMHPISQNLVLAAAQEIHAAPDLFQRGGLFPSAREQTIPLSDAARAYYADGKPLLLRLLPYWLAVLVMQLLVAAVPVVGVFYPLLKLMPAAFHWMLRQKFHRVYKELRHIDQDLKTADAETLAQYRERVERLDWSAATFKLPVTYASTLYALRAHIGAVRGRVDEAVAKRTSTAS